MEVMKLTGGKLERVIECHDYCSFQKEKIAIDFILILVVHWKFKYSK